MNNSSIALACALAWPITFLIIPESHKNGQKYFHVNNPFHATDLFWYPLKTSENQRSVVWNGLILRLDLWSNKFKVFSRVSRYNLTPPWTVPSSKKGKTHFSKKQKILFPTSNKNTIECWNMNIQLQNLKVKGELGVF